MTTLVSRSKAGAEAIQIRNLLLIPVSAVPPGAAVLAVGQTLEVSPLPDEGETFVFEGDKLAIHESQGLLFLAAPDLVEVRSEGGETAVVGAGTYAVSTVPGISGAGEPQAVEVTFDGEDLVVALHDGRRVAVPLRYFPKLERASSQERANFTLAGEGRGIHWNELDEDISVAGLLAGSVRNVPGTIGA